jgi:spermidine/putrescine transport system permease protein
MMFGQLIAAQFGEANNWPLGAALTLIMMITVTVIACTFVWLAQRGTVRRREMDVVRAPKDEAVTAGRRFGPLFIYVICYLVFLYTPSLMLPIFSFNDSIHMALPLKGFTFEWYLQIPTRPGLLEALGNSFKLAIPVAITSTTLATLAARAITRYRMPGKSLAIGFILLPMVMPGIVLAFGLLVLALAANVNLSLRTVGVAHVVMTMPFLTLVVMSRLEGLGKSLEESALDLGENAWMTFWRITFPLILPAVAACLILSFISSFDEFIYALFLGGNQMTLPVYMWTQVRFPDTLPTILALGSCIFMGSAILILTAERLRRMGTQQAKSIA